MASVASGGTAERIAARTLFKVLRAGSGTAARYSSVFFVGTLPFAAKPRAPGLAFFIRGILLGRSPRVYASNLDAASLKNGRDRPTRLGITLQSLRATTSSGVWRSSSLGAGGPHPWSSASVKRPMSISLLLSIASITLFDFSGSGSPSIPPQDRRIDLPGQPIFIFQPAALHFLPAFRESSPELIHFLLLFAVHGEPDDLVEFEMGPTVQRY